MTKSELPASVGLFGLGLIGSAIAKRLSGAGVAVSGYDPDPACMDGLAKTGGKPVERDRVWDSDLVISAVFSTDQLAEIVADAPDGTGKVLVSMSTCDPAQMPGVAKGAREKGITLIEAPISGTSKDLAEGEAILLVAGDEDVAQELAPVFDVLARAHFLVGEMGNGNRAKLAINLVLGLSRVAVAEGIVFARAVGLDPERFLELALQSAASSKVMASKGPKMVAREFSPLGRVNQSAKDFGLIWDQAQKAGQGLPMAQRYLEVVADSIANGEGELDNSAVMLAVERANVLRKE